MRTLDAGGIQDPLDAVREQLDADRRAGFNRWAASVAGQRWREYIVLRLKRTKQRTPHPPAGVNPVQQHERLARAASIRGRGGAV